MRSFIWKYVPHSLISIWKLLFQKKSFLYEVSYLKSLWTNKPYNKDNEPNPWLNYSAINFLDEKLLPSLDIFEYGSGISTEYYAKKARSVVAVEHYESWFKLVEKKISTQANAQVLYRKLTENAYVNTPLELSKKFHVIVVDGRSRLDCLAVATECLTEDGVIIFDDAEREKYRYAYEYMENKGFSKIKFWGLRPSSCYFDSTVVFYKRGNNVFEI